MWHGWGVMQTFQRWFILLIISDKVIRKTALLHCTTNQVTTGHKLHFQLKNPVRAKLAVINSKSGCGTAEVWCRQFRSISYHWYYHIRSGKIHLCSVVSTTKLAQAISSIFSPNIQFGLNWQQSTTKVEVAWLWCNAEILEVFHIIDIII